MKRYDLRILIGIFLVIAGVAALLQAFGVMTIVTGLVWAILFGAGGVIFLNVYLTNRQQWWALIPGFSLLGLAATTVIGTLAPGYGEWGGTLFLISIAAAFFFIYMTNREHWWSIIPAGVLLTLAIITGLSAIFEEADLDGVFFLGLGVTFGLVSFVPTPQDQMKWALIPAAVLLVMGAILTLSSSALQVLGPMALILVGLFLVVRAFFSRRHGE